MVENNYTNTEKFMLFAPNRKDVLHLTDNDKPFPPDYYERYERLLGLSDGYDIPFDAKHNLEGGENLSKKMIMAF